MVAALFGGMLIGVAAALLYGTLGRIAGISGILFASLERSGRAWRTAFLVGLVAGGWLAVSTGGAIPEALLPAGGIRLALLIAGGVLVGFGTRLGSGCTSGHGVCGLARLSQRSLMSVLSFMGTGVLCATLLRHLLP